jgi:REP element-mobilizing transposase RayT
VRGIEKKSIFLDDADRNAFLRRLSLLLVETGTECLAWTLMRNHAHFLLRPRRDRLSTFMRRLLTGYAVTFNLRHRRTGHLFQNRYKSIVCEEEPYLLELVRYVHLNPLRAGAVGDMEALDRYPWSGHAVLMGAQKLAGQNTNEVLSRFGGSIRAARTAYRQFVSVGAGQGERARSQVSGLHILQGHLLW